MPYEANLINLVADPLAEPPVVQDTNPVSWAKANANFEDIQAAMATVFGATAGLLSAIPEAGNQGAFYSFYIFRSS